MLIVRGWGVMTVLIPLVCALAMEIVVDRYFGPGFYKTAPWPLPLAFLIAAVPVCFLGLFLNRRPARVLVDPQTNEQFEIKSVHSLFWIPIQYWSLLIVGIAVWLYLANMGILYSK